MRLAGRAAWHRAWRAALVAVALAAGGGSCSSAPPRPNLLLVTVDTLRADHASAYGYPVPTTPHLEALASDGVLFESAYAPIPVTGPSHASLFTGLYPRAHGVVRNGVALDARHPRLAERLEALGYATAAVVSAFPLDRRFGFAHGFEHYDDDFQAGEASLPAGRWEGRALGAPYDRRGDATTERALAWLGARSEGPFFLWVHYFDPHTPYAPPEPLAGAAGSTGTDVALYDGEIRFADQQLGRLLTALDDRAAARSTLVVVTSDHGEGLGQHGCAEHGPVVYEEAVRVPLVVRWPGRLPAGVRVSAPVELLDVMPTVLDLLDAAPATGVQGRSLASLLAAGGPGDPRRPILLQAEYSGRPGFNTFALRRERFKYVETRAAGAVVTQELYDLSRDPGEEENLAADQLETLRGLAATVTAWRRSLRAPAHRDVLPGDIEGLRALGYVE